MRTRNLSFSLSEPVQADLPQLLHHLLKRAIDRYMVIRPISKDFTPTRVKNDDVSF